jgi:hypothetical protein
MKRSLMLSIPSGSPAAGYKNIIAISLTDHIFPGKIHLGKAI